jgi:hypothetical protein
LIRTRRPFALRPTAYASRSACFPVLETLTRIVAAAGPAEAEATSRNARALPRPARVATRMTSGRDIAAPSGVSIGIAILDPPSNASVTAA